MMISVVGGDRASEEALALAEEVGRELADRGCTLVCGGRGGVMEAACRGARSRGGHTIGILPTRDRSGMNPYVEFPIVTGIGFARNAIVVLSGDAVIAIEGSYGTLSEMALALAYRQAGRLAGEAGRSLAKATSRRRNPGHRRPRRRRKGDRRGAGRSRP